VHDIWWAIFGVTINTGLTVLYSTFNSVPTLQAVGAYGIAIVVLTVGIKLVLAPLFQWQLVLSRNSMREQRRLAPEIAKLRKKYKGDPQKLNTATMELYKEHGVNPLGGLAGCLPAFVQLPILTALYWVFLQFHAADTHFLFIQSLHDAPNNHLLIAGLPIPTIAYLLIPLLAAGSTFVQAKMMQQPPNPTASEQELQAQQMSKSMQVMMPLMIAYFAIITPAGLGLYWFISNCVAIIQQYLVNGGWRPPLN
jgi:YidC/Oxa1 family membrane protein insertase